MKHYLHSLRHLRLGAWLAVMAVTGVYLLLSSQIGLSLRGLLDNAGAVDVFFFVTLGWFFRSVWPE